MEILNPAYIASNETDVPKIVRLWMFRLFVPLGGYRKYIVDGWDEEKLVDVLGIGKLDDDDCRRPFERAKPSKDKQNDFVAKIKDLHEKAERDLYLSALPVCVAKNIDCLSELIGLSLTERKLLAFVVILKTCRILDDTADLLGDMAAAKFFRTLSLILNLSECDIRVALNSKGVLDRTGLIRMERFKFVTFSSHLDLLSVHFAHALVSGETDPINLLRDKISLSSPPTLNISDYAHIAPALKVLRPYLKNVMKNRRKGVNIFMHGAPGTGKSQLAKILAQEMGCELLEVSSENESGEPVSGAKRLCAFYAAQCFFAKGKAMILFDEVEDVFDNGGGLITQKSVAQNSKAWINRILEENTVPTLWLSNSVDCLDAAFIRRFDMVIEMTTPPKKQREQMISKMSSGLLDELTIKRLAGCEELTPAVVARAVSVVQSISNELDDTESAAAIESLISNTLEAQGHRPIQKNDANRVLDIYDPLFIHADADLALITDGLRRSKSGRLCLYGPPGTGKTAYGRWLADQMGVPLLVKKASDLLGMYVGQNEKNIARAFKQAEQENAVLLMDEVDSFLQDRRGSKQNWETSLVNEMLTQMESFSGVFIASTNLMDGLDQAALRRFDLKVKFNFLTGRQSVEMLRRYCLDLRLAMPSEEQKTQIMHLTNLTPGDFAAVARQHRFRPIKDGTALIMALGTECSMKESAKASIGFLD